MENIFEESKDRADSKHSGLQYCIFCNKRSPDQAVYSLQLGRMGICLKCAYKAVATLESHNRAQQDKLPLFNIEHPKLDKSAEYYLSRLLDLVYPINKEINTIPQYVPSRIKLACNGQFSCSNGLIHQIAKGHYDCTCDNTGNVFIDIEQGCKIQLPLHLYEVVTWTENVGKLLKTDKGLDLCAL